jgi:hypothetical protein
LHDFRNPVVFACSSHSYCCYAFTRLKLIFVLLSAFWALVCVCNGTQEEFVHSCNLFPK